jgi:hypothetical protein
MCIGMDDSRHPRFEAWLFPTDRTIYWQISYLSGNKCPV